MQVEVGGQGDLECEGQKPRRGSRKYPSTWSLPLTQLDTGKAAIYRLRSNQIRSRRNKGYFSESFVSDYYYSCLYTSDQISKAKLPSICLYLSGSIALLRHRIAYTASFGTSEL